MVRHSIKGGYRQCMIAASMAVQLAGCGGEDSSFVSSAYSAVPANRAYSSASSAATNGSVTLNWVAPVARADGSPISLADIMRSRIAYGNGELLQPVMYCLAGPKPIATNGWLNTWRERTARA